MFNSNVTLEYINKMKKNMVTHLGIEFTEVGKDFISAKMPVDHRTQQPFGILHGGASVVLAETLGSVAANCCIDNETKAAVGLEINANHLKSVRSGFVVGKVTPFHLGRSTHVWQIEIRNESNDLVCVSRITISIIDRK
ncbi:hotdog fold thioesterase [Flexithrix dorotheae]|uniref:hotdog fold thioesterase n=1 Tax=Flexithrix dorotheae TaxID=70993 RepID=UPI000361B4D7